jgi:hypothetical protein
MSTAAVFLDTKKAFNTTYHFGLLYKLSEAELSITVFKLIATLLTNKKKLNLQYKANVLRQEKYRQQFLKFPFLSEFCTVYVSK